MKAITQKKSWRFLAIAALAASVAVSNANAYLTLGDTKWGGAVGTGATVTYSFMATGISTAGEHGAGSTFTHLSDFMPLGWEAQIDAAFAAWSAVANITFSKIGDSGHAFNAAGATADIRIGGAVFDGAFGVLAHAYGPPPNGISAAGDIHFDIGDSWKIGFGGSASAFDIFQVAAHEIGHAIGLDHTGVAGSLMNPSYTEAFSGPQADEIAGAVYLYGAPVGTPPTPGVPDGGATIAFLGVVLMALVPLRRQLA